MSEISEIKDQVENAVEILLDLSARIDALAEETAKIRRRMESLESRIG